MLSGPDIAPMTDPGACEPFSGAGRLRLESMDFASHRNRRYGLRWPEAAISSVV
jgi:hypothetical protein